MSREFYRGSNWTDFVHNMAQSMLYEVKVYFMESFPVQVWILASIVEIALKYEHFCLLNLFLDVAISVRVDILKYGSIWVTFKYLGLL